jgi:site-specific recombinase XerD
VSLAAFPGPPAGPAGPAIDVAAAVDGFLACLRTATTRHTYAKTLTRLAALAGDRPVAQLTCEDYAAVMDRWSGVAPATWNRHLSALVSFTTWAQRQDLLETNPARRLTQRTPVRRGDRAIGYARLETLFTDDRHGLRERVLWLLLYETAARAEEILSLDVADLDLQRRRARVIAKGGAIEYVHWATATARLLPRLLDARRAGPVFLTDRRAPASGRRVPAAANLCPITGRGRLSYPRAEYLFKQATAELDPHREGWTLHQLRHSALQHLAEAGRTAPELQAKSRHQSLTSLGRYIRLGEETSARITAEHDPAARRRSR